MLIVDDDEDDYTLLSDLLASIDWQTFALDWVAGYDEAREIIRHREHDVYIIDYRLEARSGLDLIRETLGDSRRAPMILLTGHGDHELDVEAMGAGAADYLVKGHIDAATLERAIRYAIQHARLYEQAQRLAALEERQRLARDLHDAVSQTLFSASVITQSIGRQWERTPEKVPAMLEQLERLIQGALAEMRGLLLELRPADLEQASLADLLRQLVDAAAGRTQTRFSLAVAGHRGLPADVKIALYRMTQEALNNVLKHAEAGHVRVELVCGAGRVSLDIVDDGRGFDTGQVGPGHLGLKMMRERAEASGIAVSVTSSQGAGTRISMQWPSAT